MVILSLLSLNKSLQNLTVWGGVINLHHSVQSALSPIFVFLLLVTYSLSRANLLRLSRNSVLPPWWKCRVGREVDDSFSLKIRKVQPSSFTVMDLRSLTLKVNAHLLLSWLWFREPERTGIGISKHPETGFYPPGATAALLTRF